MSADTRRALALVGVSPPQFAWCDLPWPPLGDDEVQIAVEWAGINPSDLQFAMAASADTLPLVLGGEVAGRVTAVGSTVQRVAVGDRVVAYLAQGRAGYACAARVREVFVGRVGDGLHSSRAAASVVAGLTALACLEQAGTVRGRSALVLGAAGGVGSMLLPLLRSRGAEVTATARSEDSAHYVTSVLGLAAANVRRLDLDGAGEVERNLDDPSVCSTSGAGPRQALLGSHNS